MKSETKIKPASVIPLVGLISIFIIGTSVSALKLTQTSSNTNNNELLLSDNILDNSNVSKPINTVDNGNNSSDEVVTTTESNDENITNDEELVIYDGLTRTELIEKFNRNLNSTLSGKGELFVDYSLELGLDPYLALAIVLHETGCSWECSRLVKVCNNVGGQKGENSCEGGSYRSYPTLDEGIKGFMDNLYNNFYSKGLTTPEAINPRYAASTAWAGKINYYMQKIKAS